jgi:hypothetical protein
VTDLASSVSPPLTGVEGTVKDHSIPASVDKPTVQEAQESEGGTNGSGKLAQKFSRAVQGHEEADSGLVCVVCWEPLGKGRRGPRGKVHPECRLAFDREARRLGAQRLLRRRMTTRTGTPRRRLTARTKRLIGLLVAAGSVLTGIPVPVAVAEWLTGRKTGA